MTIHVHPEVEVAVRDGRPVVALESTIITHGLPRPRNLAIARDAEAVLRERGVVPATVGVVEGRVTVGLTDDELAALASDDDAVKCSIRDLPMAVAAGRSGGTTVAATALLAHQAGIRVFPTGGLGGVHRGATETYDESADLVALSQIPIVMVSAGVKSILDIGATLERLETLNVGVVGFRTDRFPGFYIADSGYGLDHRCDSPQEVAAVARARDDLGLTSAIVVANPVATEHQLDADLHDRVLREALAAADAAGIRGHDTTPYLLEYFHTATGGASESTNVHIYLGNVALGGEIAVALR
ncbi:MAG TPA: pseudouridine-5'-phosphate glycosidase [Propionibacteriaceae bacterium]|nr:pseudouridine-5'-phosphate glycosidase [Propionibacteriaceae bacterium]